MSIQTFIILTAAQRDAAKTLNRADYAVEPVLIDNAAANALGLGTLVGLYVLPARLLTDPNYTVWASLLSGLPASVMDGASLFNPTTL